MRPPVDFRFSNLIIGRSRRRLRPWRKKQQIFRTHGEAVSEAFPSLSGLAPAPAVAQEYNGVVVTGDPEFKSVADIIDVEWLPRR